jgi:tRNA (guanine37-N1)-methyltransferase
MNFVALTIFPEMFDTFWEYGIIKRAIGNKKIAASAINIRDFAEGKHRVTDDRPFGGGCGMVMKPEPLAAAIRDAEKRVKNSRKVLLTPQGRAFDQRMAEEFSRGEGLILICGRYEGVDERICYDFIDDEVSIGDYVLTGGELAAMVIIEAVTRLIPGTLGGEESAEKDSFSDDLLEHAHFTRPREFEQHQVPDVLLSGNHEEIEKWRKESSLIRTFLKRKDLLQNRPLSGQEMEILKKWCLDIERIIKAQSIFGADTLPGGE